MLLEKINGPADLKKFNASERQELAKEMRAALLKRASIHGGHFGPDFGMVEATIRCLTHLTTNLFLMFHIKRIHIKC